MISSIRLQNFRSWRDASFEFEPGVNIIVGPNASGKTNLLEAVVALAKGSSFKPHDADMVQSDKPWGRLDGTFEGKLRTLKLKVGESLQKSLDVNGKEVIRIKLDHTEPTVHFEPNHLVSLTTSPQARRDYIDSLAEATDPNFKRLARSYYRTLAQRNALLKRGHNSIGDQLFAWDVRLGELGAQIALARQNLINSINKQLPTTYSKIARKKSSAAISYKILAPVDVYATRLVNQLQKELPRDIERGFTGVGPHREDVAFIINGHSIGSHASRGEVRSLLLALKILELKMIESARGRSAIFLLDDVFSELDNLRRQALVKAISSHQAIITTTDADAVLDYFASKNYNLIALNRRQRE